LGIILSYLQKIISEEVNDMPRNTNKLLVPGSKQAIDQMRNEIANEFGVNLGPETASRLNGSVGGEITKRLVAQAQQQLGSTTNGQSR